MSAVSRNGRGEAATGLVSVFTWVSFSGRGFGATGRRQHTLLCRADMGRPLAWRTLGVSITPSKKGRFVFARRVSHRTSGAIRGHRSCPNSGLSDLV